MTASSAPRAVSRDGRVAEAVSDAAQEARSFFGSIGMTIQPVRSRPLLAGLPVSPWWQPWQA